MAIVSALLTLASCAPQAFLIKPEMRAASKSGLNFNGKSMAVVYITDDDKRDDTFNSYLASGFAAKLEEDYFGGAQAIELFKMPHEKGADITSRDTLVSLVMQSGRDVVFLFDKPEIGDPQVGDPMKVLSDKDFVSKLVRTSYSCFEKYSALVAGSTDQWESDRLFTTDTVLIVMGLSEAKAFPELPLRVTINEYVEISKYYSTPKSRRFVNGLLDRLIKKQIEEGDIAKNEIID